ncbi:hypothetical protein ASU33_05395 [Solirubrum puertoriconensis]|uniref:GIY-YIG domain-containing protein n=2 Tax=Solirubrum puertoriconensis TaxID=1751427 RepID=A0A9X0HJ19_SOLP1|nr:hypothetical protein ASU33_05395 [Solirubrum puertoriconensis]
MAEHRSGAHKGFTKRYNVTKLIYFEEHTDINAAIAREKQLKAGRCGQPEPKLGRAAALGRFRLVLGER